MLFLQIHHPPNLDVYSFFPVKNAVQCPKDLWFESICASLKMKHSVLILEEEMPALPPIDEAKRFIVSDNWCWLAPRGLSLISEAYRQKSMTFQEFKTFLKTSK